MTNDPIGGHSDWPEHQTGALAQWCGLLWLMMVVTWWVAAYLEPVGGVDPGPSAVVYGIGYFSLLVAEVLLVLLSVALVRYHGGLGWRGVTAPSLMSLAVPISVVAVFYVGWGVLVMAGCLLMGGAMRARDQLPRWPTLMMGGGLLAGAVAWALLRLIDGTLLEYSGLWGTSWMANLVGVSVGGSLLAVGLFGIGRWLREQSTADAERSGRGSGDDRLAVKL